MANALLDMLTNPKRKRGLGWGDEQEPMTPEESLFSAVGNGAAGFRMPGVMGTIGPSRDDQAVTGEIDAMGIGANTPEAKRAAFLKAVDAKKAQEASAEAMRQNAMMQTLRQKYAAAPEHFGNPDSPTFGKYFQASVRDNRSPEQLAQAGERAQARAQEMARRKMLAVQNSQLRRGLSGLPTFVQGMDPLMSSLYGGGFNDKNMLELMGMNQRGGIAQQEMLMKLMDSREGRNAAMTMNQANNATRAQQYRSESEWRDRESLREQRTRAELAFTQALAAAGNPSPDSFQYKSLHARFLGPVEAAERPSLPQVAPQVTSANTPAAQEAQVRSRWSPLLSLDSGTDAFTDKVMELAPGIATDAAAQAELKAFLASNPSVDTTKYKAYMQGLNPANLGMGDLFWRGIKRAFSPPGFSGRIPREHGGFLVKPPSWIPPWMIGMETDKEAELRNKRLAASQAIFGLMGR